VRNDHPTAGCFNHERKRFRESGIHAIGTWDIKAHQIAITMSIERLRLLD